MWKINSNRRKPRAAVLTPLHRAPSFHPVYFLRSDPVCRFLAALFHSPWVALAGIAGPSSPLRSASVTYDMEETASNVLVLLKTFFAYSFDPLPFPTFGNVSPLQRLYVYLSVMVLHRETRKKSLSSVTRERFGGGGMLWGGFHSAP